ncbi:hypothetical protein BHE74_00020861 [Ensete ventricosum]|nr:hypothetical protein GW17_00027923 [Ensete ventricosum]RWW71403.1 hypothetical protein BHE74_00020861 [Ensete ventricosum]RZR79292.1 hypothetical protein BHM03_00004998 [Ensete ventricosum]
MEPLEEQSAMGGKEGSEHQRLHRHELHQDVEGGPRCVLQRVAYGVTDHRGLVRVRTLGTECLGVLGNTCLSSTAHASNTRTDLQWEIQDGSTSMYFFALSHAPPVLEAEIATYMGWEHCWECDMAAATGKKKMTILAPYLHPGNQRTGEDPGESFHPKERAGDEGGEHDESARRDHLPQRRVRGDLDAGRVVGLRGAFHEARNGVELPPDLLHHLQRRAADAPHGHGREPVRKHGSHQQSDENLGRQHVDEVDACSAHEGSKQGKGDQSCRSNSEPLMRKHQRCQTKEAHHHSVSYYSWCKRRTLPMAAVVLPAESKASVLSRILRLIPAISAIPPALSLMGPYASMERPVAIVLSIPRAATAIPYMEARLKLT